MKRAYPVIKRESTPPSINFIEWVAQFGPVRLARSLSVSRSTVHAWVTLKGKRSTPRKETALDIVALSRIEPLNGKVILTSSDILGEVQITNMEVHR